MFLTSAPNNGTSLLFIEGGLTAIIVGLSFGFPRICHKMFASVESVFKALANKQGSAVAVVGTAAFALRLAIIPLVPVPHPFLPDDFSFLLAADTFAAGRLANPTPAMWMHFESIHISMLPTYGSMYFPGVGLVMALSTLVTGHPWYGLACMSALMCAALCWMLQGWMPPTWALLGGVLAILRLGLFSYWTNTYTAGGSVAALGGALVLGGLPRLLKYTRPRDALWMAVGASLLLLTRPYEGLLLCLPVLFVLLKHFVFGTKKRARGMLIRVFAIPLALVIAATAWLGFYDYRAFGNALTPPYKINRSTYAIAPYYVWQSPRLDIVYRHPEMRRFYNHNEMVDFEKMRGPSHFISQTFFKAIRGIKFFAGILLLPPLIMYRRVLLDRRMRFLVVCVVVLAAGMTIEFFLLPHYLAACTAAFYALGLQAMRHLRVWSPGGSPVGRTLVRLTVVSCVVLAGIRLAAGPLHISLPTSNLVDRWYGPGQLGQARADVQKQLEALPGRQLAIVRYAPDHDPFVEWVYNKADIEHAKVIWAREMSAADNASLASLYKDREVLLIQPDRLNAVISPYPAVSIK